MAAALCTAAVAQTPVKNLYTSGETLDLGQLQNTEQTVQLNRYLFAGWNTLCLPLSYSAQQFAAQDIRLERLVGIAQEGNTLNLYFLDCTNEGIQAGQPYLVFSPRSQMLRLTNIEATAVSDYLKVVRFDDRAGNVVSFGSSWTAQRQEGRYGIPAKQETTPLESILIRTDSEKAFLPTRCGFSWEQQSATATDLAIRHIQSPDEATGITSLDSGTSVDVIYDLSGRKLTNAGRGIVIQNGKKVLK